MNEKDVQSQKLRTREGFGTRTPDAMIKFPRVAIEGGTLLLNGGLGAGPCLPPLRPRGPERSRAFAGAR